MEKKRIYIVLVRTNTLISRLIQFAKKDKYTHAAISLDDKLDCMYSFGRKYTLFPFIGRFKREAIDKGIYKFHKTLPGIILEVEVSHYRYQKVQSLVDQFILKDDILKYNYLGLVHGLFNRAVFCEDRFTCSESVYYVLKESGISDLKIPRNLVRPQNLLDIEGKVVFRGNLKEYRPCNNYGDTGKTKINKMSAAYGQA